MVKARGLAERYARSLLASEPTPPFLIIVDVGHTFEIFADFTQAGKAYLHFPDPRSFRMRLAQLANDSIRERLKLGAHYTPRACVERLVLPTVVKPLRAE